MGFRFRRTIRVFPGIRLNLSRSGISTSVGVKGARVTVGHGRVRETVGIPGSGAFYTQSQSLGENAAEPPQARRWLRVMLWVVLWFIVGSVALFWMLSKL